ncbi:MAG: hypothetical protein ACE5JL_17905, partial [Dehalococcoidia bacterium]
GSQLKVIWAVLCQSSVVDRYTINLSLFNIIEEITVASTPPQEPPAGGSLGEGVPAIFELVTLWARSIQEVPERGYGRTRLIVPGDESQMEQEYEVDLTQYLRLRHRMRISGLPIRDQGTHRFVIDGRGESGEWAQMFEVPLRVVIQTQET